MTRLRGANTIGTGCELQAGSGVEVRTACETRLQNVNRVRNEAIGCGCGERTVCETRLRGANRMQDAAAGRELRTMPYYESRTTFDALIQGANVVRPGHGPCTAWARAACKAGALYSMGANRIRDSVVGRTRPSRPATGRKPCTTWAQGLYGMGVDYSFPRQQLQH